MLLVQVYFNVIKSEEKHFKRFENDFIIQPFNTVSRDEKLKFLDNYRLDGHCLFDIEKLSSPEVKAIQNKIRLNKGSLCLTFTCKWSRVIAQQQFEKLFASVRDVSFKDFKKTRTVFQMFPKLRNDLHRLDIITRVEAAKILRDTEKSDFQTTLLCLAAEQKTAKESYEIARDTIIKVLVDCT